MARRGYVRIDVDDRDAQKYLNSMNDRGEDFRPLFRKAEKELSKAYTKNFLTNGSLVGGWKPLDKQYGSWKSRNYPGASTLIQSGKLFRSIRRFSVREIGKRTATFGTDVKVAKFHQYGTWSMPERRVIFEPPMFAKNLAKDSAKYVKGDKSWN